MLTADVILTQRKAEFTEIPVKNLEPSPYQPRNEFSDEGIERLAKTFRHMGILEPLCVRRKQQSPSKFELIAGERRLRAAKLIGLETVPCVIAHYTDEEAAQASLVENTAREDLDPISKARAMERLINDFNYKHEELAEIIGISRSGVTNQLRLLRLDARLQHWLVHGEMTEGHGKVIAGLKHDQQYSIAYKAMANRWSVRVLERAVEEIKAGKPTTIVNKVIMDELTIEAKEAAKKIGHQFGCKADVMVHKNKSGYFQLRFSDTDELKRLNNLISDWCVI